jgi:hypothetical protein
VLLAELVGGIAVGLLCAWGGGRLGAIIGRSSPTGWGDLVGAVLGIFFGYVVGVTLGVYAAGRLLKRPGSFWLALAGSILGGALAALLVVLLRLNQNTSLFGYALFFGSLALALVGYNLRRRA